MSEYTTRPRVRTVTASPQTSSSGSGAAAAGVVLAGVAVAALLRAAGQAWASTRTTGTGSVVEPVVGAILHSPKSLGEQFSAEERQAAAALLAEHRDPADVLKIATALALERTPFHACGTSLNAPVSALLAARDISEVEQARASLLQTIERDHMRVFVQHLSQSAAAASREAGFESIEIRPSTDGASVRVIATDQAGRSLVSEVAPDEAGDVNLATEAVGITDGSCHTALDAFDAALERRGVRSGRPERTTTGGVCELAFAREFLRGRGRPVVRPVSGSSSTSPSDELSRRRGRNRPTNRTSTKS